MRVDKDKISLMGAAELRRQAEERLQAKTAEMHPPLTGEEMQRLVHELEVHQIELEMQNAELRQARDNVEVMQEKYSDLYDFAPVGYCTLDRNGAISAVNLCGAGLLGGERSRLIGRCFGQFVVADARTFFSEFLGEVFTSLSKESCEVTIKSEGNSPRSVQIEAMADPSGQECRLVLIDITDRKRAEAAILAKNEVRLSLIENQEAHWLMIENLPIGVIVHAPDTRIVLCNPEAEQLLGMSSEQMLDKEIRNPDRHFVREDGTRMPVDELPVDQVIATGHVLKNFVMGFNRNSDEEYRWVQVNAYPEFDNDELLRQVVVMFTDISDIKCADERIRRHLEHLTALVEIDRAINFSFDLHLSLTTLLTHVIVQLGVDAADVLLFNPTTRMLEYVAGRGFHTKAIEHTRQPLGEGYAGEAAQQRIIKHIPDLEKEHDSYLRKILLSGENFVSYHGVPLIAKGQVVGVLEVFQRTQQQHDDEWHDFLKALAAQAAIAIDNVTLFDKLQRSNRELADAYNATIEGWSRALELRDNETEGHAQRVAVLTVRLARLFGLSDAELVQVRWGALLHDIGKMGIPDEILLKHETLTEAERSVMKKHTVFAYELLSPICYLRPALDIPYAHHEKWDGTGYPLGLKGEQIPLAARIFAVVDVWDALRSDRRYHASWTVEKVREHLRSLSGTHFDPHVVTVCLDSDILVD
ncbi:MAG TPA: HD domain-containing phosphohydrolase [Dongiaceae bacterium]|nr:HD domain-containing phosphohydrolase [Dongiaceae bacterium]